MRKASPTLDPDDLVLLILLAANEYGGIDGRTAIQKIAYFVVNKIGISNDYIPHYYGPYSQQVAYTLGQICSLGLVEEKALQTGNNRKLYSYSLTGDGREYADGVKKHHRAQYNIIKQIVDNVNQVEGDKIESLACAAKIHYLVTNSKERITLESAKTKAKNLGWNLSDKQVINSVDILKDLKVIG